MVCADRMVILDIIAGHVQLVVKTPNLYTLFTGFIQ